MPLRESNPVKVALVLWIGVLLLVRGIPYVQHRLEERRGEQASVREIESWAPAVRALNELQVSVGLERCPNVFGADPDGDAFDRAMAEAFRAGYPCWRGPGTSLAAATALVADLRAAGATAFVTECAQRTGQVWCDVQVRLSGVPVRCSTQPDLVGTGGALSPDVRRVHLECALGQELVAGGRHLPKQWKRIPLPVPS